MRPSQAVGLACFVFTFLFAEAPAKAASPASETVAPLGFAIGKATRREVEGNLRDKARLRNQGTNRPRNSSRSARERGQF